MSHGCSDVWIRLGAPRNTVRPASGLRAHIGGNASVEMPSAKKKFSILTSPELEVVLRDDHNGATLCVCQCHEVLYIVCRRWVEWKDMHNPLPIRGLYHRCDFMGNDGHSFWSIKKGSTEQLKKVVKKMADEK